MIFSEDDKTKVIDRYRDRFKKHGHSQEAVGWGKKGKQELRFSVLASYWDLKDKRVIDIGAGFGDLYAFLKPRGIRNYHGIELVPELAHKGREVYGGNGDFQMTVGDFLSTDILAEYDLAFISGLFNFRLVNGNNYEFIESVLTKAFNICKEGIACNFVTDRVDYQEELIFNARPERVLDIGLKLTKNLQLRNDYFPFEFSLYLNVDDTFSKDDTIFKKFKNER